MFGVSRILSALSVARNMLINAIAYRKLEQRNICLSLQATHLMVYLATCVQVN